MPPSACLEIHQVDVGQGDCTVIVNRNLAALEQKVAQANASAAANLAPIDQMPWCRANNVPLDGTVSRALVVDGGNDCYGVALRNYLIEIGALIPGTPEQPQIQQLQLEILVTHYHDDHQDGLRSMMRDPPENDGGRTVAKFRPEAFYKLSPNAKRDIGVGRLQTILNELQFDDIPLAQQRTAIRFISPGGTGPDGEAPCIIPLGAGFNDIPINVVVVAADRAVLNPNGVTEVPARRRRRGRDGNATNVGIDQNDRSMVLVVEYGSFRHLIGGDAGGQDGTAYADIESCLAPALREVLPAVPTPAKGVRVQSAGHCCSLKLNHHGSKFSNDSALLEVLQPRLGIISSGVRQNFFFHPAPEVIQRLKAVPSLAGGVFATELASRGKSGRQRARNYDPDPATPPNGTRVVKVVGSTVIRPFDGDLADLGNPTAVDPKLRIQVYGDCQQTPLFNNPDFALRATDAAPRAPDAFYPMQPVELICGQH